MLSYLKRSIRRSGQRHQLNDSKYFCRHEDPQLYLIAFIVPGDLPEER